MGAPDTRDWDDWFIQGSDTCCFVYAVANCLAAHGRRPTRDRVLEACKVARCLTGNTISAVKVVEFFDAPLTPTSYPEVLQRGGVINIWHPIFNGHSFYLDHGGEDGADLRLINSWLGPPVAKGVRPHEIRPYITGRCGMHWALEVS